MVYRSGALSITGVLVVPNRPGRHPVVVIAHGYNAPARYTAGSMLRARAGLPRPRAGSSRFQIDYRNYARSTRESPDPVARPLGYPADLVNAVVALKKAHLPFADATRIGLFGRSMGGGVVLDALVARPHLAQAAVLYSPVSSLAVRQLPTAGWSRTRALRERVEGAYGTPTSRPAFWRRRARAATSTGSPYRCRSTTAPPTPCARCAGSEATTAELRGPRQGRHARTSTPGRVTASTGRGRGSCTAR